jgi:hypothetical protein
MKSAGMPTLDFLSEQQRKFFVELPAQVQVFRSRSRPRVRGIAWTTDRIIAEGFARGHRGIRVPDPILASAIIPNLPDHCVVRVIG